MYGCGAQEVKIQYRPSKTNTNADALSRHPQAPAPMKGLPEAEVQVQVAAVESMATGESVRSVTELLLPVPVELEPVELEPVSIAEEQ